MGTKTLPPQKFNHEDRRKLVATVPKTLSRDCRHELLKVQYGRKKYAWLGEDKGEKSMTNNHKGGYRWSNGVPMTDKIHGTIEKFYEYAKAQGSKETKKEVYAKFEKMLMDAAGLKTEKNYYR